MKFAVLPLCFIPKFTVSPLCFIPTCASWLTLARERASCTDGPEAPQPRCASLYLFFHGNHLNSYKSLRCAWTWRRYFLVFVIDHEHSIWDILFSRDHWHVVKINYKYLISHYYYFVLILIYRCCRESAPG